MDKLINNYEKRINTFVLQMAENPIIVKKDKNKFMTTREELYADTSYKILDKKGFIFSTYKTDKERIKDYLDQRTEKLNHKKHNSYLVKDKKFIQPLMRFKARTDLERVYDALSTKVDRNNEKDILNRQLKNIDLLSFKKADDYLRASQIFLKNKNKINIIEDEENDEEKKGKGYKILPNPLIQLKEKNKTKKKKKEYINLQNIIIYLKMIFLG